MANAHLAGGNDLAVPRTSSFNLVLKSHAVSRTMEAPIVAEHLVVWIMSEDHRVRTCQPDVTGYTSVVAACASTYGSKLEKSRSFDLAHATFT